MGFLGESFEFQLNKFINIFLFLLGVFMHMCFCVRDSQCGISFTSFLERRSFAVSGVTNLVWLADQQTSQILLHLPSQYEDYGHIPPQLASQKQAAAATTETTWVLRD